MGGQGFLLLIDLNIDDLDAKHCHFGCSCPLDIDGVKIFDKDDQALLYNYLNILQLVTTK